MQMRITFSASTYGRTWSEMIEETVEFLVKYLVASSVQLGKLSKSIYKNKWNFPYVGGRWVGVSGIYLANQK